ncbi:MAG: hypothetical protein WBF43_00390, partial [Methylocella sp.]
RAASRAFDRRFVKPGSKTRSARLPQGCNVRHKAGFVQCLRCAASAARPGFMPIVLESFLMLDKAAACQRHSGTADAAIAVKQPNGTVKLN